MQRSDASPNRLYFPFCRFPVSHTGGGYFYTASGSDTQGIPFPSRYNRPHRPSWSRTLAVSPVATTSSTVFRFSEAHFNKMDSFSISITIYFPFPARPAQATGRVAFFFIDVRPTDKARPNNRLQLDISERRFLPYHRGME